MQQGGRAVPKATIHRRYGRSVVNLFGQYMPVVTGWKVYDNSAVGSPRLIAKQKTGQPETIFDHECWFRVQRSAVHG